MSVLFLDNWMQFLEEYKKVDLCFKKNIRLPNQIFKSQFTRFWFAEFDALINAEFGPVLKKILHNSMQDHLNLFSISPDCKFLEKNFGHYGMIRLKQSFIEKEYEDALRLIPKKGTIADSLLYNVRELVLISSECKWCIYGDRVSEILVMATEGGDFFDDELNEIFFPIEKAVGDPIGNAFSEPLLIPEDKIKLLCNYRTQGGV